MPSSNAEIYFIAVMMVLILVFSFGAVYFFFRQYRKEMKARTEMAARKRVERESAEKGRGESENVT
jgi:hypothetical protein